MGQESVISKESNLATVIQYVKTCFPGLILSTSNRPADSLEEIISRLITGNK